MSKRQPSLEVQMAAELDEIFDKHIAEATLQPGEVSAAMMAEKRGVSVDKARAVLTMGYKNGELTRRQVRTSNGKPLWVYRPAK